MVIIGTLFVLDDIGFSVPFDPMSPLSTTPNDKDVISPQWTKAHEHHYPPNSCILMPSDEMKNGRGKRVDPRIRVSPRIESKLPLQTGPVNFAVMIKNVGCSHLWGVKIGKKGDVYIMQRDDEKGQEKDYLPRPWLRSVGRPLAHRVCLSRSFLAKMALNIPTTSGLRERLLSDVLLRSLCSWSRQCNVPSAPTFSRAFQEFATARLPSRIHEALIKQGYAGELVGHSSRDSAALEARERPVPKSRAAQPVKRRKRGRPKKGEERSKVPRRLEQQLVMELEEMLKALPKDCTVGRKRNAKGHTQRWTGYKLHMDTADGGVPISCLVTSASLHDSQAAIPLASVTE
ncbi:MAG: transposase [Rhodothermaceae bacterium]|nr:transposase [Rhodothermaceae bacterium]